MSTEAIKVKLLILVKTVFRYKGRFLVNFTVADMEISGFCQFPLTRLEPNEVAVEVGFLGLDLAKTCQVGVQDWSRGFLFMLSSKSAIV